MDAFVSGVAAGAVLTDRMVSRLAAHLSTEAGGVPGAITHSGGPWTAESGLPFNAQASRTSDETPYRSGSSR